MNKSEIKQARQEIAERLGIKQDEVCIQKDVLQIYDDGSKTNYIDISKLFNNDKKKVLNNFNTIEFRKCNINSGVKPTVNTKIEWINIPTKIYFDECNFKLGSKKCRSKEYCYKEPILDFTYLIFEKEVSIKETTFESKTNFKNSIFKDNVYFNNSIFNESVDFHEVTFEKTACFYGVTFEKTPNFSNAIFNGELNLVNTNFKFDFESVGSKIKLEYKERIDKDKTLDEFSNDFRDSFRLFKNALIKENNLLDASNYHRAELYCKEIELDSKNPKIFSRDWIDKWQLKFYRHTSDHHTDLLKSFNSLIITIGLFGLFSAVTIFGITYNSCNENIFNLSQIFKTYNENFKDYIEQIGLMEQIDLIAISLCIVAFFVIALVYVYFELFEKYSKSWKFYCVFYIPTALILATKPKYIIPASGLFTGERNIFDPLSAIGAVYTIFFLLMIFSLQKTARKNSIIPT